MLATTSFSGRLPHVPLPSKARKFRTSERIASPCAAASAVVAAPPAAHEDNYAVIKVGSVKHYVYEGSSFACSKQSLEEVSMGGTVRFKVLALKHSGELQKGRPYLEGAVVEGRLEDEFRGPDSWSSMSSSMASVEEESEAQSERMLRRILITRIHQG